MTGLRDTILARAERYKRHYPKEKFTLANLALAGDAEAGLRFMDAVSRPRVSFWSRLKAALRGHRQ